MLWNSKLAFLVAHSPICVDSYSTFVSPMTLNIFSVHVCCEKRIIKALEKNLENVNIHVRSLDVASSAI